MKFSIITPTFNRAHTIERAIKSMQNQTYDNWEMIIVDDGSTDNTENIVRDYMKIDNRIKYFKKENGGVGSARNFGFKNISKDSEWVGFLDSDDIFIEDALEKMVRKIQEFPDIKHFAFSTIYENGKKSCKLPYDNFIGDYRTVLGEYDDINGEFNSLLHRSTIDNGFFFEESVNGYEWIARLRLAKSGVKVLYTTTTTRIYITIGESLLRVSKKSKGYYNNVRKGLEIILNEFGVDLKRVNKKRYALYLYSLANINIILANKKNGLKLTILAFKYDCLNLRVIRNLSNFFKTIFK